MIILKLNLMTEEMQKEAFEWWFHRHDFNLRIIAKISGVSLRSVQRWETRQRLPRNMALMVNQIKHGPIVWLAVFRGDIAIREDLQHQVRQLKSQYPMRELWIDRRIEQRRRLKSQRA